MQSIVESEPIASRPALASALWLYIDELDRSHRISQGIDTPTGSFWHGIMHRREGDFGNSHYWFRNTGEHPAMEAIDGYDGHAFIDEVEAIEVGGDGREQAAAKQRAEWVTLFEWCSTQV